MLKKKKNQIFCVLQQREKTTIAKADAVFMFWINCEEVNERITTNKIGKRIYYRNSIEERKRKFFFFN